MGSLDVAPYAGPGGARHFTKALLRDIQALELMLADGRIESGIRRLGAEQELFLVDQGWRPAPVAVEVLEGLERPEFTTELGRFNLEINLPPMMLEGSCLTTLHDKLHELIGEVRVQAQAHSADVVLTGILPTLSKSHLSLDNMMPRDRYRLLNDTINRMSGGAYRLHIQGADELNLEHDSVMLEACNTSFQIHLQVNAEEFARIYNVAQAVLAPVLAAAVNSPLLFGRRLWSETRIALFQQAIDTRRTTPHVRELTPRVRFGEQWVEVSIAEVFQEDIARIPAIMGCRVEEEPLDVLREGGVPKLEALQLYNSTLYRWNRPCYGVLDGKPHLRIECRVLPSGPSIIDEVANAAFWVGCVLGADEKYEDITRVMNFDDARGNLVAAARRGLDAGFTWIEDRPVSAQQLILDELLPVASAGLERCDLARSDIELYLGIIRQRVESRCTGARWLQRSLSDMSASGTRAERTAALTAGTATRQRGSTPCHEWDLAVIGEGGGWRYNYRWVEQYMTTDLYTVKEDELVDLAALIMDWKRIRQVPVEDYDRNLMGLVSYGAVLRLLASGAEYGEGRSVPVKEIMQEDPLTVGPETTTRRVIQLMRERRVTSLPVVKGGKLIGIVTMDDFLPIADRLLEERESEEPRGIRA